MEVNIRKATAQDYIPLCDLIDEVDALHRGQLPRLFQKPPGPVRKYDYYWALITDEKVGLFIAEVEKEIIGFVHAIVIDSPPISVLVPRFYAIVDNIGVKSDYQNHGIGKVLIKRIQDWAIEKGATSMEMNVYEFNETAFTFYTKLGYKTFMRRMRKELKVDDVAD